MGPLAGVRVLEIAGLGIVPFACMLLADMGAEVVRISRPARRVGRSHWGDPHRQAIDRGRQSVVLDLARPEGRAAAERLAARADLLVEGMRPGVMERLGMGPEPCLAANPRLIYGRVTGWGRRGPLAPRAGHDINFLALSGALHALGRADQPPAPPPAVLGDFAAGAMQLALGLLAALWERERSGRGQVVEASVLQGAATLMTPFFAAYAQGRWRDARGENVIDSGAPYYDVYACADGRFMAVGANEPQFFAALLEALEIRDLDPARQFDRAHWPAMRTGLAAVFSTRTRDDWAARLEGLDVCATPVLSLAEAPAHPHNREGGLFAEQGVAAIPSPMPAFGRTSLAPTSPAPAAGAHTRAILAEAGFSMAEIDALITSGAAAEPGPEDQGRTP